MLERAVDFFDNPSAEFRVMTSRLGADLHVVGHDVRRLAAANYANIARAIVAVLFDRPVPAALDQIGNRERSNGYRADPLGRRTAGVTCKAANVDRHPVSARGSNRDLGRRSTVEIERQARLAQQAKRCQPRTMQADLFLNGPQ